MPAPALVIQHLEPEGPYAVGEALARAGVETTACRTDQGDEVPTSAEGLSALVVMGGPMAADDDAGFPTRRAELALLADAVERGVPTLGVCLGAQLLAAACGAKVHRGDSGPEVGWGPVELSAAAADDPLLAGVGPTLEVLHWHGDTYELPVGAEHLARSSRYEQQAFRVASGSVPGAAGAGAQIEERRRERHAGPERPAGASGSEFGAAGAGAQIEERRRERHTRAWGLQFHLEVDEVAVTAFCRAFADEAEAAPGGRARLLDDAPAALAAIEPVRRLVFDRFAALVAGGGR